MFVNMQSDAMVAHTFARYDGFMFAASFFTVYISLAIPILVVSLPFVAMSLADDFETRKELKAKKEGFGFGTKCFADRGCETRVHAEAVCCRQR